MMEQTHLSVKHDDDGFRLRRMSRVANFNIFGILCLHVCMHACLEKCLEFNDVHCLLAYLLLFAQCQ
jgi:hypothetical protein